MVINLTTSHFVHSLTEIISLCITYVNNATMYKYVVSDQNSLT